MNQVKKIAPHIVLLAIGAVWVYPFFWMLSSSLKTNSEYFAGLSLIPEAIRWDNYIRAWDTANFSTFFSNTVILTLTCVLIVVTLCALTGYALGRVDFIGNRALIVLVTATLFIPKGYTIIPTYQVIKALGLLNTLPGVILAESGGTHVLFLLLFYAYFRGMPKELEESAEIDGCGFVRTFAVVMLPLAKPIIATTMVMQFMWTWNSFFTPLVLTLSNPDIRPLSVGMYAFMGIYNTDYTGLAAAATISTVPIVIVFILLQRYFVEGVSGAVKG